MNIKKLLTLSIVLSLTFTALKLIGHIDWSWLWVFSPIWITLIFSIMMFYAFMVILLNMKKEN